MHGAGEGGRGSWHSSPPPPPWGLLGLFCLLQASVPSAPRGNCNNANRLIWPRHICSPLAAPKGRMEKIPSRSGFVMAMHTLLCLGCLLISWVRVRAGTQETNWGQLRPWSMSQWKRHTYEQDPTAVGSGHCDFSQQGFKLKLFRYIFHFFYFLSFH